MWLVVGSYLACAAVILNCYDYMMLPGIEFKSNQSPLFLNCPLLESNWLPRIASVGYVKL